MQARQKLTPTSHFFYFYFWWDKGVIFIVNMVTLPTYLYINIPPLIIYYSFLLLSIVFTLQAICLASVIWSLWSPNKYQPYLLYISMKYILKVVYYWYFFCYFEYNNSAIYLTFYDSYSIIVLPERNLVRSIAQCRFY